MSAIPCASVSMKTMADGTLRVSFDIEPSHAQDAFRLFASPGTPAAIAALQVGYAAAGNIQSYPEKDISEKPKGGPLSIEAAAMCRNPEYLYWVDCETEKEAADHMRYALGIKSRAELDNNNEKADAFIKCFRGPFMKHMLARGKSNH